MYFYGRSCGAEGEAFGEIVFNTSMVGYQEIVSDPSYAGQIVTLTYPQVGNYGINEKDMQADRLHLAGLVVHDMCYEPSNWQSVESLPNFLASRGVVAIEDVDTRALTIAIREGGAMRAAISTTDLDPESLIARVKASPSIADHNYVADVSTKEAYTVPGQDADGHPRLRVVAYDCGEKRGIARRLSAAGCEVTVVPWDTPVEEALAKDPDGVFFSNGPGDPEQAEPEVALLRQVLDAGYPFFGICFGNQLLGRALGFGTYKLKFGHRGINQPVKDLTTGKVEVTAHNHGFAVDAPIGETVDAPFDNGHFGKVFVSHIDLNDDVVEGLQCVDIPAFSVQYHPEAAAGPHDASYLFDRFVDLMRSSKEETRNA